MRYISIILILSSFLAGQSSSTVYFMDGLTEAVPNSTNQWLLIGGMIGTGIACKYDDAFNDYAQNNELMPHQMAVFGDYWGIGGELLLWGVLATSENNNEKLFLLSCGVDQKSVEYSLNDKFKYSILTPYFENPSLKKSFKHIF